MFHVLGQGIARAIIDQKILDIPISPLFYDLVLDRPITFDKLACIDRQLYQTLSRF